MFLSLRPGPLSVVSIFMFMSFTALHANTINPPPLKEIVTPHTITNNKNHTLSIHAPNNTTIQQLYLSPGGPVLALSRALPYPGLDLVWLEDRAYIAAGDGGLIIVNYKHKTHSIQSQLSMGDSVNKIVISHHHAWLAAQRGLYTVDIRDPNAPRARAFIHTAQAVTALTANNHYTALVQGREIQLFDSRRPGMLIALSTIQLDHDIHALALAGDQLYIAAGKMGVLRYQITPDQQLLRSGHYKTTGPAIDIHVSNNIAAVATQQYGLTLLDTRDPLKIHWLGSHQQLGNVTQLHIAMHSENTQLILTNAEQQLLLMDISNPRMPALLSSLQMNAPSTAFMLRNKNVMALINQQLTLIDFSATPPQLSNEGLDFGQGVNYGGERRIFIRNKIAYVADWFSGIHLYDISAPHQPRLLSSFHTAGSAKGIAVRGDYAYVADDDHGLQVINIRNPRRPFKVGSLATSGLAYIPVLDPTPGSKRLFLASHHGGFHIIDISDPEKPGLLGHYDTAGKTWAIRIRDNIAYIADDESGLMMFDVSQPDHIQLLGQFSPGGAAEDIILHNDIAYVAFFDRGLYIIDISDPGYPKKIAHIKTPGNARGIARQGTTLYIADWLAGVQVIDVSDPSQATLTGSYDTAGAAWGLALQGNFAFIMDWWGGFTVLDISLAERPALAGRYHHRDRVQAISIKNKIAYAASGSGGLQIYDLNNPLNPTWMTGIDFDSDALHVATTDNRAYVALANNRIAIINTRHPFSSYSLREIRSPYPIVNLHIKGPWLYVSHAKKGLTLYRIDGKYADKPRKKVRLNQAINSVTALNDHSMAIAQADSIITIYAQIGDKQSTHQFAFHSQLLKSYAGHLISYADNILSILDIYGNIISQLNTPFPVIDLQVQHHSLYLLDKQRQLTHIDLTDITQPVIRSQYQTRGHLTRISTTNDTLYLSGNTAITALQPLADTTWVKNTTTAANTPYQLNLRARMPTGSYHLHINARRFDNALHIVRPKFKKSSFSMQDLEKALEKIRAQATH